MKKRKKRKKTSISSIKEGNIVENKKIKVYIVDIEENTIDRLEELFYSNPHLGVKIIGYAYNYNNCINDFGRAKDADVFLVSAYLPDTMGTELIGQIKKLNPKTKVIVMLQKNTRNLAEISKEKGADDFIQKPFKARQLIEKLHEITGYEMQEEAEDASEEPEVPNEEQSFAFPYEEPSSASNDYPEAPAYEESNEQNEEAPHARRALFDVYSDNPLASNIYKEEEDFDGERPNVVCVFSSTGSNGKTTMLVNTAIAVHKHSEYKPRICIVDFNLLFPSVIYKFHQDDLILCKKNIYDLFDDINNLNEQLINSALITHEPTGIKILETPSDVVRDISRVNPDSIQVLLTHLREMFDLILIDTSSNIRDDATSYPLTIADKSIVLLEPDLANLLHTRKLLSLLKMFESNSSEKIIPKLQFVLNKENPKAIIHVDTIKRTLFNADVRLTIPEDNNITHLSNNGQFVMDSNSPSVRSIKELANLVYPLNEEFISLNKKQKTKEGGFLSSFFNKKK